MRWFPLLISMVLAGCSLTGRVEPSSPDRCNQLDDLYLGWTAAASVSGGLGGAASTATAFVTDQEDAVLGLSISGAVLTSFGLAAGLVAGMYASRYAEQCGGSQVSGCAPGELRCFADKAQACGSDGQWRTFLDCGELEGSWVCGRLQGDDLPEGLGCLEIR